MESPVLQVEQLLKATEVAEILNISRSTSYQLIRSGQIRSVHIGRARRVRPTDLSDYISKNLSPAKTN